MKIALGADHAGYFFKKDLIAVLEKSHEVKDFGTSSELSVDFPDYAHPLAEAVEKGEYQFGILICGSANGVAMAANKHTGIRAAVCWNVAIASLARQHNDANIICLPARFINFEEAQKCINIFLETAFEGGRHEGRVNKISQC